MTIELSKAELNAIQGALRGERDRLLRLLDTQKVPVPEWPGMVKDSAARVQALHDRIKAAAIEAEAD